MSEGEEIDNEFAIENEIKTVYTTDKQRVVFSDQAASRLESFLEQVEKTEQQIEIDFNTFWKKILAEGNYKFQIKENAEGRYFYVYKRGESQKIKVILLGTPDFTDKRNKQVDEEEEEDHDIADLAVNLFEGASGRKTNNNKDTREIDLNKVMYKSRDLGKETEQQPADEETQ